MTVSSPRRLIHTRTHIYIYTHIYTYTHAHTYIHRARPSPPLLPLAFSSSRFLFLSSLSSSPSLSPSSTPFCASLLHFSLLLAASLPAPNAKAGLSQKQQKVKGSQPLEPNPPPPPPPPWPSSPRTSGRLRLWGGRARRRPAASCAGVPQWTLSPWPKTSRRP